MITYDYQGRVDEWIIACFGADSQYNRKERAHRFMEEALELYQATGGTRADVTALADYVYGRPVGEPKQEVGGVMVTLAALCTAIHVPMFDAASVELTRCFQNIPKIRAKNNAKRKDSALPGIV